MINDLQTINTNDYDTMAKAMGIANERPATASKQSKTNGAHCIETQQRYSLRLLLP